MTKIPGTPPTTSLRLDVSNADKGADNKAATPESMPDAVRKNANTPLSGNVAQVALNGGDSPLSERAGPNRMFQRQDASSNLARDFPGLGRAGADGVPELLRQNALPPGAVGPNNAFQRPPLERQDRSRELINGNGTLIESNSFSVPVGTVEPGNIEQLAKVIVDQSVDRSGNVIDGDFVIVDEDIGYSEQGSAESIGQYDSLEGREAFNLPSGTITSLDLDTRIKELAETTARQSKDK